MLCRFCNMFVRRSFLKQHSLREPNAFICLSFHRNIKLVQKSNTNLAEKKKQYQIDPRFAPNECDLCGVKTCIMVSTNASVNPCTICPFSSLTQIKIRSRGEVPFCFERDNLIQGYQLVELEVLQALASFVVSITKLGHEEKNK